MLFGIASYGVLHYALLREKETHLRGREERLLRLLEENRARHVTASLNEQLKNYALVTHEGNLFQLRRPDGTTLFQADVKDASWTFGDPAHCRQPVFHFV